MSPAIDTRPDDGPRRRARVPAIARAPVPAAAALALALPGSGAAAPLNLTETPLFIAGSKTALVQLVVERDNKLFYEAYPTYEDLDGDGDVDIRYEPGNIDYYGYFDPGICYRTDGAALAPTAFAADKKCTAHADAWSGDFLNYLTMTRMDLVLRALYGGRRIVDTANETVLRRAFVPWENHTWGIEYGSATVDGYLIEDYSPLDQPAEGTRHLFATNNIVSGDDVPYLRVREDDPERIWDWVEKERVQGDGEADRDVVLDVRACVPGFLDSSCRQYPNGGYKPVGLLHEYGENESMYFSLLTGSYENNVRGGVLRKNMGSFRREIDPATGVFTAQKGIVHTLDALRIPNDYENTSVQRDCGWIPDRSFANGECRAWGNPVAEMMYEGLRHFSGTTAPTSSFHTTGGMDGTLGLEAPAWVDPFAETNPWPQCSAAYQLVVSDPSPSFDGDQLPGSHFANFTDSSLGQLHVGNLADAISSHEDALPGPKFIGEADGVADGAPSVKDVDTFRTIRGQAPEAPHRQGSYYAPSVAWYGRANDLHPDAAGHQSVGNFTLALGSPLPTIDVPVGDDRISFVPFAKTVGGCYYADGGPVGDYAPTNALVGFVVEELTPTSGTYRVSFEDMEQGADNDMDALARYRYDVVDGEVVMQVTSLYASGCLKQHLGYAVSGSDADGVHLVVRDADTGENLDEDFPLDVPPGALPGSAWDDGEPLPLHSSVAFAPTDAPAAEALASPLWYAAKWGGFDDRNGDGLPQAAEWDGDGDGDPDNYFPATQPARMVDTLRKVFERIAEASATATATGVSGGVLTTDSYVYETRFRSVEWTGELTAHEISPSGDVNRTPAWDANEALADQIANGERRILTWSPLRETGVPFRWPEQNGEGNGNGIGEQDDGGFDIAQAALLSRSPVTGEPDDRGEARLDWLRGADVEGMRERVRPLGDIVHSTPQRVGAPVYRYPDDWGEGAPESAKPYSAFGRMHAKRDRVVYVGANDGMLHGFDAGTWTEGEDGAEGSWSAGTGHERFAYVPSPVYAKLPRLPRPDYGHAYYVDATPRVGDAFVDGGWATVLVGGLGRGGQGVYALDVTDPDAIDEDAAGDTVLWEFTDADDADLGYTFDSPLIVRMHDGKWAAVLGNGYNNGATDAHTSSTGEASLFVVDLETGELTAKLSTGAGTPAEPNGLAPPTAVDLDNDDVVDVVYAGDLRGNLWKFDVSEDLSSRWGVIGDAMFGVLDTEDAPAAVTTPVAVGRHPTGTGTLVYVAGGKYLEPSDQTPGSGAQRVYALWDEDPMAPADLSTALEYGYLLEQRIVDQATTGVDTDGDGTDDVQAPVRSSTTEPIDWASRKGWYVDLGHGGATGERVIAAPLLRENRLIVSTQVPSGDQCDPAQDGWLMLFDAASGAMPATGIDLDGDGTFDADERFAGVRGVGNPMAPPAVAVAGVDDVLLTSDPDGGATSTTSLDARTPLGRLSWRELEP